MPIFTVEVKMFIARVKYSFGGNISYFYEHRLYRGCFCYYLSDLGLRGVQVMHNQGHC